jgi:hypothetical protein
MRKEKPNRRREPVPQILRVRTAAALTSGIRSPKMS